MSGLGGAAQAHPALHAPHQRQAERFIQTLLREWAYRWPYLTSDTRTAALTGYLHYYNRQRPHASLGRRSPWTRFQEAA